MKTVHTKTNHVISIANVEDFWKLATQSLCNTRNRKMDHLNHYPTKALKTIWSIAFCKVLGSQKDILRLIFLLLEG